MAYHTTVIPKGIIGEVSKIEEEVAELLDALHQGNKLIAMQELSDIYGALELVLLRRFPGVTMNDLCVMQRATRSAFLDGTRKGFAPEVSLEMLKRECVMIHFFGLGFIQIKLKSGDRVHVYHPELPAFVEEPHDHRYDFRSFVLGGAITNTLYEYAETDEGELSQYHLQEVSCEPGFTPRAGKGVRVVFTSTFTTAAGSSYVIGRDQLHTIKTTPLCVTYLRRSPHAKEFARVLKSIHQPNICPFSKVMNEDILWEIVSDAFKTFS